MGKRSKHDLKRLFTGLRQKRITDAMMHTLIDRLWSSPQNLELDGIRPRANEVALASGTHTIAFNKPFPQGTDYVLKVLTIDNNSYQVAHKILTQNESGFEILLTRDCSVQYVATPKF